MIKPVHDPELTYDDYVMLTKAQAGELDRFDEDQMTQAKPLFDKKYIAVMSVKYVYLTESGLAVLKGAGWERKRTKEWLACYPEPLPPLENK
jgi:hypothetical protein